MRVDLDLLPILNTLLVERSVSRTAARLNLTQPAISYALAKLRDQLGDPLLVKSGNKMKPTPRALALELPLREALAALETAVSNTADFDPSRAKGELRFGVEEYAGYVILPHLIKRFMRDAPNMKVLVYRIGMAREEVIEAAHAFDFVFSRLAHTPVPFERDVVLVDTTVLVGAKAHPIFDAPITLDRYLQYPHMVPTWQHSIPKTFIDQYLENKGRKRSVRLGLPPGMHMTLTGMLDDILTAIPGRFGLLFADSTATRIAPMPIPIPPLEVSMVWHNKYRNDGQHRWMREVVKSVCAEIAALPIPGLDQLQATQSKSRKRR